MSLLNLLLPVVTQVLDRVIEDPKAVAEAKLKVLEMAQAGQLAELDTVKSMALAQIEVNKVEASGSTVQRNWRPMIGWVCAAALAWDMVIKPLALTAWVLTGHSAVALPDLSSEQLYSLLGALLGLGGFRTFEKVKAAT